MSPRDSGAGDRGGARRMLPSVSEVATELGRQVAADPAVLYKVARQVVAEELAKVKQGLESAPLDTLVKRARRVLAASEPASAPKQPDLFATGGTLSADEKAGRDLSAPFEVVAPPPAPPEIPAPPARSRSEERGLVEVPKTPGRRFDRVSAELPAEAVSGPPLAPPEPMPAEPAPEPAPAPAPEPPPPPPPPTTTTPSPESYLVKPASPSLIRRIAGDAPAEPVPVPPPLVGGAGPETPALESPPAESGAPEGHIPSEDEETLSAEFKSFSTETLERLHVTPPPLAAEVPLAAPADDRSDATRPVAPAPPGRSRSWRVAILAFAFVAAVVAGGVWWLISQGGRVVKTEAVRVEAPPKPAPPEAAPAPVPTPAPAAPAAAAAPKAPPAAKGPPAKAAPKPAPPPAPAAAPGRAAVMVTKDWTGKPPVFVLHFSSHKDRPSAEKEAARLAAVLFKPGHAVEVDLADRGIWYRVVIGEFGRVEEARAFRDDLAAKNTPGMGFIFEMRGK